MSFLQRLFAEFFELHSSRLAVGARRGDGDALPQRSRAPTLHPQIGKRPFDARDKPPTFEQPNVRRTRLVILRDAPLDPSAVDMGPFHAPTRFEFVETLEDAFDAILAELRSLDPNEFVESPDSLTTVANGFDERGWRSFGLWGDGAELAANRSRCPVTVRMCEQVPGLVHAGFSLFRPGTHLYPHRGERTGVLRCHLPLIVPEGDVGIRFGDQIRSWHAGRCFVFDDTFEHEAWNHTRHDRVVLIVTFRADAKIENVAKKG